jgi:hypothetical protein
MTVYIKVKKKFGITARDQSIRHFEPGVYEIDEETAKNPYVKENSKRIAAPDDRLKQPVIEPPMTPPRRIISPPLPPIPKEEKEEWTLAPLEPDNSAIHAANEAARAKEAVETKHAPGPITRFTGAQAVMRGGMTATADDDSDDEPDVKRGPGRPKKTA